MCSWDGNQFNSFPIDSNHEYVDSSRRHREIIFLWQHQVTLMMFCPGLDFFEQKQNMMRAQQYRNQVQAYLPYRLQANHQCSQFNLWLCINNSYTLFCHRRPFLYSFFSFIQSSWIKYWICSLRESPFNLKWGFLGFLWININSANQKSLSGVISTSKMVRYYF